MVLVSAEKYGETGGVLATANIFEFKDFRLDWREMVYPDAMKPASSYRYPSAPGRSMF